MKSITRTAEAAGRRAVMAAVAVLMAIETAKAQQKQSLAPVQTDNGRNLVVLVSIPDRKLAVIEDGNVTHTFPVAVGTEGTPSPTGEFTIISRIMQPTYYHPGIVIPPGPQNPLGTRWIGLSKQGFGIHGTNAPKSIGKAASHGCIRMRRADLEQLFTMVRSGDAVVIRGERDAQVAQVFGGVPATTIADAAQTVSTGGSN